VKRHRLPPPGDRAWIRILLAPLSAVITGIVVMSAAWDDLLSSGAEASVSLTDRAETVEPDQAR
jgi:hypothetical protein